MNGVKQKNANRQKLIKNQRKGQCLWLIAKAKDLWWTTRVCVWCGERQREPNIPLCVLMWNYTSIFSSKMINCRVEYRREDRCQCTRSNTEFEGTDENHEDQYRLRIIFADLKILEKSNYNNLLKIASSSWNLNIKLIKYK